VFNFFLDLNLQTQWVEDQKIDGESFFHITHDLLEKWGVNSFGERFTILKYQSKTNLSDWTMVTPTQPKKRVRDSITKIWNDKTSSPKTTEVMLSELKDRVDYKMKNREKIIKTKHIPTPISIKDRKKNGRGTSYLISSENSEKWMAKSAIKSCYRKQVEEFDHLYEKLEKKIEEDFELENESFIDEEKCEAMNMF